MNTTLPSSRSRQAAVVLLLTALVMTGVSLVTNSSWAASDFNKEIAATDSAEYEDQNTTLRVWPVERILFGNWGNEPTGETHIGSDRGALIEIRDNTTFLVLDICYVEIRVDNGTPTAGLSGWSTVLSSGDKNGETSRNPFRLTIPSHPAMTRITFQVRMNSTNWNVTFPTPTALNGMNFTYIVRYSADEIVVDKAERAYTLQFTMLATFFLFASSVEMYYYPKTRGDYEDSTVVVETEVQNPEIWFKYMCDRIQQTDNARHNLILEGQVILFVLATVASFVVGQSMPPLVALSAILLAGPLVLVFAFLMIGPRTPERGLFVSDKPKVVLSALKQEYLAKVVILERAKGWVSVGTFYALIIVIATILSPLQPVYHIAELAATRTLLLSVVSLSVGLAFYLLYSHFVNVKVETAAKTTERSDLV